MKGMGQGVRAKDKSSIVRKAAKCHSYIGLGRTWGQA